VIRPRLLGALPPPIPPRPQTPPASLRRTLTPPGSLTAAHNMNSNTHHLPVPSSSPPPSSGTVAPLSVSPDAIWGVVMLPPTAPSLTPMILDRRNSSGSAPPSMYPRIMMVASPTGSSLSRIALGPGSWPCDPFVEQLQHLQFIDLCLLPTAPSQTFVPVWRPAVFRERTPVGVRANRDIDSVLHHSSSSYDGPWDWHVDPGLDTGLVVCSSQRPHTWAIAPPGTHTKRQAWETSAWLFSQLLWLQVMPSPSTSRHTSFSYDNNPHGNIPRSSSNNNIHSSLSNNSPHRDNTNGNGVSALAASLDAVIDRLSLDPKLLAGRAAQQRAWPLLIHLTTHGRYHIDVSITHEQFAIMLASASGINAAPVAGSASGHHSHTTHHPSGGAMVSSVFQSSGSTQLFGAALEWALTQPLKFWQWACRYLLGGGVDIELMNASGQSLLCRTVQMARTDDDLDLIIDRLLMEGANIGLALTKLAAHVDTVVSTTGARSLPWVATSSGVMVRREVARLRHAHTLLRAIKLYWLSCINGRMFPSHVADTITSYLPWYGVTQLKVTECVLLDAIGHLNAEVSFLRSRLAS
jgi:hypothetical protein